MRILVFDDNQANLAAARAQLKDHDLTVVDTYDEAKKLLTPQLDKEDEEKISAALKSQFGDFNPYYSDDAAKKAEYFAAMGVAYEQANTYPDFDVVLSDLLVPASWDMQSWNTGGKEMPVGIFIGLLAAVKAHAKYIAVFTDCSHHSHPASACFDAFNYCESSPTAFMVEQSKVLLSNNREWVNWFDPNDLVRKLEHEEYRNRSDKDKVQAKNWAALLAYLTAS